MTGDTTRLVAPSRDATLQALKTALEPLDGGPGLYEFMVTMPDPSWGTTPGRQYALGRDEDDGSYRSVLSWKVRGDGSVDFVRVGRLDSRRFP